MALTAGPAAAHSPGRSLLNLEHRGDRIQGRMTLYYGDLPLLMDGLPFQAPDTTTEEWAGYERLIVSYLHRHVRFSGADGPLSALTRFGPIQEIDAQANVIVPLTIQPLPAGMASLIIEQDGFYRTHPQFTTLIYFGDGAQMRSLILSRTDSRVELYVNALAEARAFLGHGFAHIMGGIDHILFILLLIFSPFLLGEESLRRDWRQPAWQLVKLATAFTVAHSLTLAMAVLKLLALPTALIEGMIMFSLIFMGIHILLRLKIGREWLTVFAFGLFHGYGFSGALHNLGLSRDHIWVPLTGFNVGVELGQLLVIALVFPVVFVAVRRWPAAVKGIRAVTVLITLTACWWLFQIIAIP